MRRHIGWRHAQGTGRRAAACAPAALALAGTLALTALAGCAADGPVTVSRTALGTVVTITAYGDDDGAVREAVEDAYAAIAAVEAELDAYSPDSAIAAINESPYTAQPLPDDALTVLDAVHRLDVADAFSVSLLGVVRQYGFEASGTVPGGARLARAVAEAAGFERSGDTGRFAESRATGAGDDAGPSPGLDFGGAAKGLALDRAREALRASGAVTAAIVTSGSSTVTLGTKPDGAPWRIGVEDPRDPDRIVAVFAFAGDGALSTSGDYQRYFEADGVRYHHVLDPGTGLPARGVRSLTVAGVSLSGLDADILSTALMVRGASPASGYARSEGIALYAVDDEGQAHLVPAPASSGLTVSEETAPLP